MDDAVATGPTVSRVLRWAAIAALTLAVGLVVVWGALAVWYQMAPALRWPLLVGWTALGVAALAAPWLPRGRDLAYTFAGIGLCMLAGWWISLHPSHARQWADDVAQLVESDVDAGHVVLRNVRNFDWRTDNDYTVRWETREYDLDGLVSADLILSYWMGPHVAHTLVSFGFDDGRQLVFSMEIRKERGEAFSAVGGFFKQFETVLVAADEHDIVRVRTNVRGEDVYLYRLDIQRDALRQLFLGYLDEAEQIRSAPRFYNTLTSNCTTIVFDLARRISPSLPMDYRLLLSGHFAQYAHELGGLSPGHDYPALRAAGRITDRARAFDGSPGAFPQAIRTGVPGIDEGGVR